MKITLIGSTRFAAEFAEWNARLSMGGHLVYSLPMFGRNLSSEGDKPKDESQPLVSDDDKVWLEMLHFRKILDSDAVLIVNVGGYMGPSTHREILWAYMNGKKLYAAEADDSRVGFQLTFKVHGRHIFVPLWETRMFR